MLRIFSLLSFIIIMPLLFSACAENDAVENPPENNADHMSHTATDAPYSFVHFNLDADFDGIDNTVEAEYKFEDEDIRASYKDKSQNIDVYGDEALQHLDRMFSTLTFDKHTEEDEVLDTVIDTFNLPNDAKIVLDVIFEDGTEREYIQM